jgi:hypothetical protein
MRESNSGFGLHLVVRRGVHRRLRGLLVGSEWHFLLGSRQSSFERFLCLLILGYFRRDDRLRLVLNRCFLVLDRCFLVLDRSLL